MSSCGVAVRQAAAGYKELRYSSIFESGRRGPLAPTELEWAKTAWKYFQNNTEGPTGLPGALDKNPIASAWTIADYLAALNAARELGRDQGARVRGSRYASDPVPEHDGAVRQAPAQPELQRAIGRNGERRQHPAGNGLVGARFGKAADLAAHHQPAGARARRIYRQSDSPLEFLRRRGRRRNAVRRTQERRQDRDFAGRTPGLRRYAALGFQAWGFDTRQASRLEPFGKARIESVVVLYDSRDPRQSKTLAPVVTLPHALMGVEFNWEGVDSKHGPDKDRPMARVAQGIYAVQEARYRKERILTARTDHPLGRAPNLVYDSIFLDGYPWNTITADGTFAPNEALVSTRAAFGMWALWKTAYTRTLMQNTQMLNDPARGWFEGRFEKTGGPETTLSSTTNAMVLEALLYMKTGKLFRASAAEGYYGLTLRSEFSGPQTCLPQRR